MGVEGVMSVWRSELASLVLALVGSFELQQEADQVDVM